MRHLGWGYTVDIFRLHNNSSEGENNFGITNIAQGGHIGGHIGGYIEFCDNIYTFFLSCMHIFVTKLC